MQLNRLMEQVNCPIRLLPDHKKENANSGAARRVCQSNPNLYFNHSLYLRGKQWVPFAAGDLDADVVALARELYKEDFRLYDDLMMKEDDGQS